MASSAELSTSQAAHGPIPQPHLHLGGQPEPQVHTLQPPPAGVALFLDACSEAGAVREDHAVQQLVVLLRGHRLHPLLSQAQPQRP